MARGEGKKQKHEEREQIRKEGMVVHFAPRATCSVLIGGLLRYRVTEWHQVAMGNKGTSANETDVRGAQRERNGRERPSERGRERESYIHRLSLLFKTRGCILGLDSMGSPSEPSDRGSGDGEVWIGVKDQAGVEIQPYSMC